MMKEISITFMSGRRDGETIRFPQPAMGEERILTVGRREHCDIVIDHDGQVSRMHARIGCVAERPNELISSNFLVPLLVYWLEDDNSRNGTYIEREPQPIIQRVTIRPGMLFRIGRTWLRVDVPMPS